MQDNVLREYMESDPNVFKKENATETFKIKIYAGVGRHQSLEHAKIIVKFYAGDFSLDDGSMVWVDQLAESDQINKHN